jgi:shikimate dehydrogenase
MLWNNPPMPDRYCVVGHPIAHSKSPQIHLAFARATGHDVSYERLLAPLDGFVQAVGDFVRAGGRGCNVTAPFKQQAFELATTRTPRAELAGAVNTLSWRDGAWHGDNTDGAGLVSDLVRNLDVTLRERAVLVLGAGGATRGVLAPLLAEKPARLVVANRTEARAAELASLFGSHGRVESVALERVDAPFDVVINATSASDAFAWPAGAVGPRTLAYDMSYGDQPTPFLRWAGERGAARAVDGLGMLIEQAAESYYVWRGVRPHTRPLFSLLRPAG